MKNSRIAHFVGTGKTFIQHHKIFHRSLFDDFPDHFKIEKLLSSRTTDRQLEGFSGTTPKQSDRLRQSHILGELIIDLQNLIAGQNPGTRRRAVLTGGDNGKHIIFRRDRDSNPLVSAVCIAAQLIKDLRLHELTMRVQIGQHSLQSAVDQFFIGHLFRINIALANSLENFCEQLDFSKTGILNFLRDFLFILFVFGIRLLRDQILHRKYDQCRQDE